MIPAVGTEVLVRFEKIQIACAVRDVKMSYGVPRLLVAPAAGQGEQWIELGRLVRPERPVAIVGRAW